MKTHTTIGAQLLAGSRSPVVQMAEVIARTHHEKWDGTGYPEGLRGEEIPLVARICAVCDVFDALVSDRPYKDGVAGRRRRSRRSSASPARTSTRASSSCSSSGARTSARGTSAVRRRARRRASARLVAALRRARRAADRRCSTASRLGRVDARFAVRGDAAAPRTSSSSPSTTRTIAELGSAGRSRARCTREVIDRLRRAGARAIAYDVQFTEPSRAEREDARARTTPSPARPARCSRPPRSTSAATRTCSAATRRCARDRRARRPTRACRPTPAAVDPPRATHGIDGLRDVRRRGRRAGRPGAPVDARSDGALIDFPGPPGTIPTVLVRRPARRAASPARALRGRVVVVGASAPSLQDLHPTPTSGDELMSGPEVQANAISTVLRGAAAARRAAAGSSVLGDARARAASCRSPRCACAPARRARRSALLALGALAGRRASSRSSAGRRSPASRPGSRPRSLARGRRRSRPRRAARAPRRAARMRVAVRPLRPRGGRRRAARPRRRRRGARSAACARTRPSSSATCAASPTVRRGRRAGARHRGPQPLPRRDERRDPRPRRHGRLLPGRRRHGRLRLAARARRPRRARRSPRRAELLAEPRCRASTRGSPTRGLRAASRWASA